MEGMWSTIHNTWVLAHCRLKTKKQQWVPNPHITETLEGDADYGVTSS